MIVNMSEGASEQEIEHVIERIREAGFQAHVTRGETKTIVAAVGSNGRRHELEALKAAAGVEDVVTIATPFKLVNRQTKPHRTVVDVGGVRIGGGEFVVIAGPCSVESREQMLATARAVKEAGAVMLRGGAYKPRTSPYDFQGLGLEALEILSAVRRETGMPVVTEVMSMEDIDLICEHADMLQVGARNMQNFALLRKLAAVKKPVLLKRGPSATVKEWLLAAVALARELSHLPVLADPSHGTGRRSLIAPLCRAAFALGADGVIIEVHPCPERALSDGAQSLDFKGFAETMQALAEPLPAIARALSASAQ